MEVSCIDCNGLEVMKGKTAHKRETVVNISRPALTLDQRRDYCRYKGVEEQGVLVRLRRYTKEQVQCSGPRVRELVQRRIPILEWLPRYQFKKNIIGDMIAGITVAILHIPQGMGFSLLANVPPISGIYMAFFPVIAYAILSTSRHNSMGTFPIVNIMTGKIVNQYATFPSATLSDAVSNTTVGASGGALIGDDTNQIYSPIQVASIVCFMTGFWHLVMALLRLGSLTVFLNEMLVSGLSVGASLHVITSQARDLLGIDVHIFRGPFNLIKTYIEIIDKIGSTNVPTLIISVVSITVLVLNDELLKPRLAKLSKIPMPIELLVVIAGTLASFTARLPTAYNVAIVGKIPTGLPPASSPPFTLARAVAVDSLLIAIISYTGSVASAQMFARKHDYEVDANQELHAMACLASIIVVALKRIFRQVSVMLNMWKVSKVDALIWNVTLFTVVIIDIGTGLVISFLITMVVLLIRGQNPKVVRLGRVPNTDIYLEKDLYSQAKEIPGVVVVSVSGPLHFANRENFRSSLDAASGIDVVAMKNGNATEQSRGVRYLILDCQGLCSCDASGATYLTRLNATYAAVGIQMCLAGLNEEVVRCLTIMGTLPAMTNQRVFHSVHDAVTVIGDNFPGLFIIETTKF